METTRGVLYGDQSPQPASRRGAILVALAVLVVGLFNAFKPVHIDDALYLAIAKQILKHPFDPYGFTINWQHYDQLAYQVSISPPLLSYYHAFLMWLGAGDGFLLHLDMIPWLALLAWSVFTLVNRIGPYGEWAAVMMIFSPSVFAGTNLMLDVPMTACLTAGIECLLRAIDRETVGLLLLSGLLGAAAVLIKYPGIVFVGACLAVAVFRGSLRAVVPAAICLAAFVGWERTSQTLYGAGQVKQATSFLERFHGDGGRKSVERLAQEFVLLGSTFPIWIITIVRGRSRMFGLLFAVACTILGVYLLAETKALYGDRATVVSFLIFLFLGAFSIGEVFLSAFRRPKSDLPLRAIALLWILGVIGLTTVTAPFVAVRYLLPALPAILILQWSTLRPSFVSIVVSTFLTTLIGGAVAFADLRWAKFYPTTVATIRSEHLNSTIFFCGHWGLQWYAEEAELNAWDARWNDAPIEALILVPQRADPTPIHPSVRGRLTLLQEYSLPAAPFRFSISRQARRNEIGVCFYGWEFPHLPWWFNNQSTETIGVFKAP